MTAPKLQRWDIQAVEDYSGNGNLVPERVESKDGEFYRVSDLAPILAIVEAAVAYKEAYPAVTPTSDQQRDDNRERVEAARSRLFATVRAAREKGVIG